jgi:hypothetical protein
MWAAKDVKETRSRKRNRPMYGLIWKLGKQVD